MKIALFVMDTEGKNTLGCILNASTFISTCACFCTCMYVIQEVEKVTKGKKKDKAKPKIIKVGTWYCFFMFLFTIIFPQNSHLLSFFYLAVFIRFCYMTEVLHLSWKLTLFYTFQSALLTLLFVWPVSGALVLTPGSLVDSLLSNTGGLRGWKRRRDGEERREWKERREKGQEGCC